MRDGSVAKCVFCGKMGVLLLNRHSPMKRVVLQVEVRIRKRKNLIGHNFSSFGHMNFSFKTFDHLSRMVKTHEGKVHPTKT